MIGTNVWYQSVTIASDMRSPEGNGSEAVSTDPRWTVTEALHSEAVSMDPRWTMTEALHGELQCQ